MIQWGILAALFMTGLVGGMGHCFGMCGPLVVMAGARYSKVSIRHAAWRFLPYHAGRIVVYGILGFLVGLLGSLLGLGNGFFRFSAWFSLLFGVLIVLVGLGYIKILPGKIESGGGSWLTRRIGYFLKGSSTWRLFPLGVLTGLLPCGMIYSAMLVALSTGSPYWSALGMLAFGLGTTPALLVYGLGLGRVGVRYRQVFLRFASLMVVLVGMQLSLRGLASLGLIKHFMPVQGIVFW